MDNIKTIKDIAKMVRDKRKKSGFTQTELAGICNTGIRFIVDLESGKPTCQVQKVLNVLKILGIKIYIEN